MKTHSWSFEVKAFMHLKKITAIINIYKENSQNLNVYAAIYLIKKLQNLNNRQQ